MKINVGIAFVLFAFAACQAGQELTQKSSDSILEAAYYQKLGSNIRRLQALKSGLFVQYYTKSTDEPMQLWKVDSDSVMTFTRPIGEPHRDGYWTVQQQFTSALPDEPIVTMLEYIERVSRDTFHVWSYGWAEAPGFLELSSPDFALPEEERVSHFHNDTLPPSHVFVRRSSTEYEGWTVFLPPANLQRKERFAFRRDHHHLEPEWNSLQSLYYDADSVLVNDEVNEVKGFYKRMPTETQARFRARLLEKRSQ